MTTTDTPAPTPAQRLRALLDTTAWTESTVQDLLFDFLRSEVDAAPALIAYFERRAAGPERDWRDVEDDDEGEDSEPPEPATGESVDDLEQQFGEIERDPNGDLFDFDAVKGTAWEHVWTIVTVDDDGSLWALAGVHHVNRLGYVRTPRPWLTGTEQFRFDA